MDKFLKNVEIKNFKSIKDLKFDAKKVNIFIGKPNVGKSNILEALGLFCAPYETNSDKYLSSFIRYEEVSNLFYDQKLLNNVSVQTNLGSAFLRYHLNNINSIDLLIGKDEGILEQTELKHNLSQVNEDFIKYIKTYNFNDGTPVIPPFYKSIAFSGKAEINSEKNLGPIKKYDFIIKKEFNNRFPAFLLPPSGDNLFTMFYGSESLQKEITSLFVDYGLELVIKTHENKFEIQKKQGIMVNSYPYSIIADTLQRYIFYLIAMNSNKNSILLFEEPEVHSFPPYTGMLADKIALDENNQYFITTHSPYLLHTLIENTSADDLALFITYYEGYETKVKELSPLDIQQIVDDSIDVFFNLDRFIEK